MVLSVQSNLLRKKTYLKFPSVGLHQSNLSQFSPTIRIDPNKKKWNGCYGWYIVNMQMFRTYLAVFSNGWLLPTSLRRCSATLAISSLSSQRRLRNDVGYPTSFSAVLMARFHSLLLCARWLLLVAAELLVASLSYRAASRWMGRRPPSAVMVLLVATGAAMATMGDWCSRQRLVSRQAMRLSDMFVRRWRCWTIPLHGE